MYIHVVVFLQVVDISTGTRSILWARWISQSVSQPGLEAGAPQWAVQLCYWQIGAGQRAAGLSRPWHIKATGPIASPPVAPQPATSKGSKAHRRFPSKGLEVALTHASKPAKEIWLKAYYWGKAGRQRRGLAGKKEHRISDRRDHSCTYSHFLIPSLFLKIMQLLPVFKTIREKDDRTWQDRGTAPLSHKLSFFSKCLLCFFPSFPLPLYPLLPFEVTSQVI